MGSKLLTRFLARDQRAQVLELEAQLNGHVQLVDDFYRVLGPRYWVFPDHFNVADLKALTLLKPADAERGLIALYTPEALRRLVLRFHGLPTMRPRLDNIRLAITDYEAGRYYATVLMLLTVMDGFVNDVDRAQRRGLHTRDADEMVAWDSVTGHHMGLSHAHTMFTKTTRKTSTEELHDLQRHGILHGTQLNYNNSVVATKAWNQLFAVADWAMSLQRKAVPPEPKPSFRAIMKQVANNAADKKALAAWTASKLCESDTGFTSDAAVIASEAYLHAWQSKNYGAMGQHLAQLISQGTPGKTAGMVRDEFHHLTLDRYDVHVVQHTAASACEVDVTLTVEGVAGPGRMRWIREDDHGNLVLQADGGNWKLITWGSMAIYNRAVA